VLGGTLAAGSRSALGSGDVEVRDATLRVTGSTSVHGDYRQSLGVLAVSARHIGDPALTVAGQAVIGSGSVLELTVEDGCGGLVPVLRARRLSGRFAAITVRTPGYRAVPFYTQTGLSVRLTRA
jgi:hypothetical protein